MVLVEETQTECCLSNNVWWSAESEDNSISEKEHALASASDSSQRHGIEARSRNDRLTITLRSLEHFPELKAVRWAKRQLVDTERSAKLGNFRGEIIKKLRQETGLLF